MPTALWPSTTMHDVQLATSRGPQERALRGLGHWSASTPGMNTGSCLCGSWLPTSSTRLPAGLLGNSGWVFSSRTFGMLSTLIPTTLYSLSLSTNSCGAWASGTYGTVQKSYKRHSRGPGGSTLPNSWPCAARVCLCEPLPPHSGNMTSPRMRSRSDAFWGDIHTTITQG